MAATAGSPWNPGRSKSISSSGSDYPSREAISDYTYLRDREYTPRPALALVGDRYRLTRRQRAILYRGVCSEKEARRRLPRIASPESAADGVVTIDGYNVLLTLYHYLTGYPVFLCRDGLVRDAGLSHGRSARPEKLEEVARRLFETLRTGVSPHTLQIILDEAVSHSRDHAGLLRATWGDVATRGAVGAGGVVAAENRAPRLNLHLSPAADAELAAAAEGFLATSDSQVIDRSTLPVLDLPRWVLEESFGVSVTGLSPADQRGGR